MQLCRQSPRGLKPSKVLPSWKSSGRWWHGKRLDGGGKSEALGRWKGPRTSRHWREVHWWRTSRSAGRDPGYHGRGILAALITGVGGELGLVPGTTAWNWGRRTVDDLPTISGKHVVGVEGPGGGASWAGWPVTGDEPTSRPGHCQADRGGMYRCQGSSHGSGILSPGGADKALICGPIPGQASNVGKGTGSGDRPCFSIRRGQDQSPYVLCDWRHWVPPYRLRTVCPQQETLIRLHRGWRMSKGVFHRARKELRPSRSHGRGFQHGTRRTHVEKGSVIMMTPGRGQVPEIRDVLETHLRYAGLCRSFHPATQG